MVVTMEKQCEVCEYRKDKCPERMKALEAHQVRQEEKNDTTNTILTEIKDSLKDFMDEMRNQTEGLKTDNAVLKDRSNFKIDFNWKTAGVIMTFVYMIVDKLL